MQKLYVAMRALPWEKLTIQDGPTNPDGTKKIVTAKGDPDNAGFLPVYWNKEAAERMNPGAQIQEAAVGDDWGKVASPQQQIPPEILAKAMELLAQQKAAQEATLPEVEIEPPANPDNGQ